MKHKRTILIFIDWFSPGYLAGGPVQSVVSLVGALSPHFNIKVLTSNSDLDGVAYTGVEPNKWTSSKHGCEVFYADREHQSYSALKEIIKKIQFDVAYLNSFLSLRFSIFPLLILKQNFPKTPVILAPRGMLGKGALSLKSRKKKIFISVSKIMKLHARVIWHATSRQEELEIIAAMQPRSRIFVIPNIPKNIGAVAAPGRKEGSALEMCFVSRINEKKNLLFALTVLKEITGSQIRYAIYGPIEDAAYWQKCQELIRALPANIKVDHCGTVKPDEIEAVYRKMDVLLLPTLNENYGHAIVESLLCGCPVIISDQTPWTDVEANKAGFSIPLSDPAAFKSAILHYAGLSKEALTGSRQSALDYISRKIDLEQIKKQYETLFNEFI